MRYRPLLLVTAILTCTWLSVASGQEQRDTDLRAGSAGGQQTTQKQPEEFKTIFNGADLTGWDGDPRLWSVRDGVIHGETTPENKTQGNTFLIWQGGSLADFELELEFRCNATNNSGIQYRSRHVTEDVGNRWVVRGYQHEVRNEIDFPDISGFIYDEGGKRGRMCQVGEQLSWEADGTRKNLGDPLITKEEFKNLFKLDDWNKVRIVARGSHLQHYLNDHPILSFVDNDPNLRLSEGIIALQLHGGAPMWAEFRNIKLKALKWGEAGSAPAPTPKKQD